MKIVDILAVLLLLIILFRVGIACANQEQALWYAKCGQEQTRCQTDCVHIELIAQPAQGVVRCNPKNNRISQCKNRCYVDYIRCRGGK